MEIHLNNIGKKFRNEWIFRNINLKFSSNDCIAIIGPNGSGKSTFLNVVAGIIPANEGSIEYSKNALNIIAEESYKSIFFVAPYVDLIEEFTIAELFEFQKGFRAFQNEIGLTTFLEKIYLKGQENKEIRLFSSGMKQRLKLGLAFFSESEALFLDEPTTNLDQEGVNWYLKNVKEQLGKKLLIISSNDEREYGFCDKQINITTFKFEKKMTG